MKKKLLVAIGSVLLTVVTYAQTTYSSSEFAAAQDSFLITSGGSVDMASYNFDTTGANITWDYGNLPMSTQKMVQYLGNSYPLYKSTYVAGCVSACIAGGGTSFGCTNSCNASWNSTVNLSRPSVDSLNLNGLQVSDGVDLLNKLSGGLSQKLAAYSILVSGVTVPLVIEYSATDNIYKFPVQYNSKDSSEYDYAIDLNAYGVPLKYTTHKKRINYVQGWGKLITPYKKYNNTLKIRTVIERKDTVIIDTIKVGQGIAKSVKYTWFANGFKIPVLEASGQIVNGVEVITSVKFPDTTRCLKPDAAFSYSPVSLFLSGGDSVKVNFSNKSLNSKVFTWSFGNSSSGSKNISTLQNPYHWYKAAGIYTVQLIAKGPTTCTMFPSDTIVVPVIIIDSTKVKADFKFSAAYPCKNDSVHFMNLSINATTYTWTFGDGSPTSNLKNVVHKYTSAGTFTIRLIAKKTTQSDTIYKPITIAGTTTVSAGNNITIMKGNSAQLNAVGGNHSTYAWSPVYGLSCSVCPNPIASPTADITYTVTAYDFCGTAKATKKIAVTIPTGFVNTTSSVIEFKVYPNPASENLSITFNNTKEESFKLEVINLIGQGISTIVENKLSTGKHEYKLNIEGYQSGVYFVKLNSPSGVLIQKIVIQ